MALLGHDATSREPVRMGQRERSTHMQIVGSTGTGKSKLMEGLIRRDILKGQGLCLIDPHGALYGELVNWLASKRIERRIHLFDPAGDGWTLGFNPLKRCGKEISHQVDSMVGACAKVWGGNDLDRTPLLKRCLRLVFHVLVEEGLTLYESQYLTDPMDATARAFLASSVSDPVIGRQWAYLNSLKPRQFYEEFGSTINRLMEFLASERMRRVLGQRTGTLDFRRAMDEGEVVLVNLSSGTRVSRENARMLGTLIVNDLFLNATERPPESRPFYLYIDEFGQFVNEDIARILDEGRKFGLHLVLAHQHLQQLKDEDGKVYYSVMTDAKTKVVFGGLTPDDAEVLSKQMYMGQFDLDEITHVLRQRKVVDYSMIREKVRGTAYGSGLQQGTHFDEVGTEDGSGEGYSNQSVETESEQIMFRPEMGEETSSVHIPSLEYHLYRAMSIMANQAPRHALVKMPGQAVREVVTPTIEAGFADEERQGRFREQYLREGGLAKPDEEAQREIEAAQSELRARAREWEEAKMGDVPKRGMRE